MNFSAPGDVPQPRGLFASARRHWRSLLPSWLFPIVFLFGGFALDGAIGHSTLTFWVLWLPLFFWSFSRATTPFRRREMPITHVWVWAMLVPFLLWVIAVEARLAFLRLM